MNTRCCCASEENAQNGAEKHLLSIVLNSAYHVRYEMPDQRELIVTSHSARIGETPKKRRRVKIRDFCGV
jgi:hypothetical protein